MKEVTRLTDLEIKIMRVLWEDERDLTIQEIGMQLEEEGISVASVAQVMKSLLKKKAVTVCNHVLVASVYARTFRPCINQEEYLAAEFDRLQKSVLGSKKMDIAGIAAFLSNDERKQIKSEKVEELQKIIDNKKEQMRNGEK